MKKLLTTVLMIATVASAATVHYDQKRTNDKSVVKYPGTKSKATAISKPNHPSNALYKK